LFSIFIANPALKGWAIFIRPLTRTIAPLSFSQVESISGRDRSRFGIGRPAIDGLISQE